ncbi:MAG: hypothetical protein JST86_09040 [Bacteroidetes bacterium]|nr:hypothetical protein [Bacteroidota bacterium]
MIRLLLKHARLLLLVPLLLAGLVIYLTREPRLSYTSSTVLYTGLATGSTVEMDKTFNYFATNTAFDNLINIIKSRETQEEVAIRLLSQHLLLPKGDSKYIAPKFYHELKTKVPAYIFSYVSHSMYSVPALPVTDSLSADSLETLTNAPTFPETINKADYEKTVDNLTTLMKSSDTNYVYKLLNFEDPHYSIKAISTIKVERLSNSDLIKLTYEVDDPGICQQTLAIFNEVCIKNYKNIKENRSDAVIKYFEGQLQQADKKLKTAEDQLLAYNKSNNIINYYEQSKAVANVKEDMDMDYSNKKAQLAGAEASVKKLEEKLNIQEQVQTQSGSVLEKRKLLGDINFEIASAEAEGAQDDAAKAKIAGLKKEADVLQNDIKKSVGDLYHFQNSTEGLPVNSTLNDWITNVVDAENLKAKLKVMDQHNKDFQQQYAVYAPAGATIKRIERDISVSEQGYLEILHGLNLAKLKLQDNELSSNLKAVDQPYYPLQPIATKRAVLIVAAALVGFLLIFGVILAMEYMDNTIKNSKRAASMMGIPSLGMLPKVLLRSRILNMPFVQSRLFSIVTQKMQQELETRSSGKKPKLIIFSSTQTMEGKSVVSGNIARKLMQEGNKVLLLSNTAPVQPGKRGRFSVMSRLLGYEDTRIDIKNPLLANPADYLPKGSYATYSIDDNFFNAKNYQEILSCNNIVYNDTPDYVLIELPALIYNNHPSLLIKQADMQILVCRANRLWSDADKTALNNLLPLINNNLFSVVNGVDMQEAETVLGELPKKPIALRQRIKNFFRFQFFSKNQI